MVLAGQPAGLTFLLSTDDGVSFQVARDASTWGSGFSPLPFCVELLASCGVLVPSVPGNYFQPFDRFDATGIANPGVGSSAEETIGSYWAARLGAAVRHRSRRWRSTSTCVRRHGGPRR